MHDPYEAFRYVAFRLFAASYVLAVVGSQILSSTVQWDVYQQTKDPLAIGLVGLINAIPVILLALPAGHVADRFSRKRVLLVTQVPLVAAPAALAMLHAWNPEGVSLVVTFSLLGINAVALTFARPARAAILPNLVPRTAYTSAFAWMSSLFETAAWVGPAASGLLLVIGVAWAYLDCWPFAFWPVWESPCFYRMTSRAGTDNKKSQLARRCRLDCISYSAHRCYWRP